MSTSGDKTLRVNGQADVQRAQRAAHALASEISFDETAREEIAIAASELAANLVKHGHGGTLTLERMSAEGRLGLRLEARDGGVGIDNVRQAMVDRYSSSGGLGCGLGAINRLMDGMEIDSVQGVGTAVACWKWLRPKKRRRLGHDLQFGVATRAFRQDACNGDAFVFKRWDHAALVGLVDGLGHGEHAERAARIACQYIETHYDLSLNAIFDGVGRACLSTRGVVMALAHFDLSSSRLTLGGIGNIEARLCQGPVGHVFLSRRGIVGVHGNHPTISEYGWDDSSVLVLQTDGLSSHWTWEGLSDDMDQSAQFISDRLFRSLDKTEDDATVIVVKNCLSKE